MGITLNCGRSIVWCFAAQSGLPAQSGPERPRFLVLVCLGKQGDTLSPTILAILTAVLMQKVLKCLPAVQSFLFADDTLFFLPSTPQQVRRTL